MTAIGLSYLGYRSNWLLSPLGGIKERYGTHVLAAAVRVRYCWLRSDLVLDSLSAVLPLAAFPRAELPGVEHATDWLADVNTYLVNIETFEEAMRAQVQRQLGHITEHLGELLVDEQYERKVQAFSAEMLKPQEWALYQLSQQAIVVLALRRGLINGHPRTLRQVARTCHLSRKQVRQIEITALEKLKLPKREEEMGRLRDLLLTENRTPRYIA